MGCDETIKTAGACPAENSESLQADAELDLRGVICPYNFVKTKLKLETMKPGQILAVILDDGDPIRNVPRSVSDDGHTVLRQDSLAQAYRVMIRKRGDV
ncbi:MAG: sulfurtransferase TusA family protein [Nitrospira sp.]|nr:sulfurtransferase TusA family protein [Nitrospira sp.]